MQSNRVGFDSQANRSAAAVAADETRPEVADCTCDP
jgi:hypothetical protein